MPEIDNALSDIYLQPGESYLARTPAIIRTILGSCVGVTFWSARLAIGALTHSQLPKTPENASAEATRATCHRYVDSSIREIARQLDVLGAVRAQVQVKLFGGADVLPVSEGTKHRPTVGRMNREAALEILRTEGFHVTASSVGGTSGLKVRFDTRTGEVQIQRLN
jgi:chemotaxis protein CheD